MIQLRAKLRAIPKSFWVVAGAFSLVGFIVGQLVAKTNWLYSFEFEPKLSAGTLLEILVTIGFVVTISLFLSDYFAKSNRIKEVFISRSDRIIEKIGRVEDKWKRLTYFSDETRRRELISSMQGRCGEIHVEAVKFKSSWEGLNLPNISTQNMVDSALRLYNVIGINDHMYVTPVPTDLVRTIERTFTEFHDSIDQLQLDILNV